MGRKLCKISGNSTVAAELRKYDCCLIKKYRSFLNSVLEGFIDAGYCMDDIITGFKSIDIDLTPQYISMNTVGILDEKKVIVSYYRCGYSVNSISKKFNMPSSDVQDIIFEDETLRLTNYNEWCQNVRKGCKASI